MPWGIKKEGGLIFNKIVKVHLINKVTFQIRFKRLKVFFIGISGRKTFQSVQTANLRLKAEVCLLYVDQQWSQSDWGREARVKAVKEEVTEVIQRTSTFTLKRDFLQGFANWYFYWITLAAVQAQEAQRPLADYCNNQSWRRQCLKTGGPWGRGRTEWALGIWKIEVTSVAALVDGCEKKRSQGNLWGSRLQQLEEWSSPIM